MPSPLEAAYNAAQEASDAIDAAPELRPLELELERLNELVNAAGLSSARYALERARKSLDEASSLLSELLGRGAGARDL